MQKAKVSRAQHAQNTAALASLQKSIAASSKFDVALCSQNMTAKVQIFEYGITLTVGNIVAALEECVRAVESGEIELY